MKNTVASSHELKGLETRLIKAKAEVDHQRDIAKQQQALANDANNRVAKAEQDVKNIQAMINNLKSQSVEPIVSEHAILRWLQHVHGVDLDSVRAEILNEKTREAISFARTGKFTRHDESVKIVFENKTIVTVVKDD